MAIKHNVNYDPKYPWRPQCLWDFCPACFENFDFDHKCDNCGNGHPEQNLYRVDPDDFRQGS